ncbi:MAG: mevalonate kinase [Candidatus Aenigmatarchaeota archaeon]
MTTVSTPGKVHLIGEHAVVYGEPAIIAAIGLRTYIKVRPSKKITYIDKEWPDIKHVWSVDEVLKITNNALDLWNMCYQKKDFSELFKFIKEKKYEAYRASTVGIVMNSLGIRSGFSIEINSKVPIGSGLGSSASRAVAITKAIADLFKKRLSLEQINNIAYEIEKIIHGTPSGGDNSACCYGKLIWFQKSQPKNIIKPLKIPYKLENFVLVYTKPPEKTTGELVQLVRNLDENYRNERIKRIGRLAYEMKGALMKKNLKRMKEIINENQRLLAELGVSCREIDKLSEAVRNIGGAAKLCGAGGGGVMLCYHEDKEKLIEIIRKLGFKLWETELGVKGVRVENLIYR